MRSEQCPDIAQEIAPVTEFYYVSEKAIFRPQMTYIRTRFGQNQGLWSQNGDTMSPGLRGAFQLMKKGVQLSIKGE